MANKDPFDKEAFKKGIAYSESRSFKNPYEAVPMTKDGKLLSSAAGKYQFLYNNIKNNPELKGVSKEQFLKNPALQEKVMEDAINKQYYRNAKDLTEEFSEVLGDKWNYRPDEVAMLTHFLGRQGARNYFKTIAEGGEYQVAGEVNATVDQYLGTYNKGIDKSVGIPTEQRELKKKVELGKLANSERSIPLQNFDSLNPNKFIPQNSVPNDFISPPSGNETSFMSGAQVMNLPNIGGSMPSAPMAMVEDNEQPESQQSMPQAQLQKPQRQTTAGFLQGYLANNQFEDGGYLNEDPPNQRKDAKGDSIKAIQPHKYNKRDEDFNNWYNQNTLEGQNGIPYSDDLSYDYYSFFKNNDQGNIEDHFPDTYKRPSHPTFSTESIYSTKKNPGGSWLGENYVKPRQEQYMNQKVTDRSFQKGGYINIERSASQNTNNFASGGQTNNNNMNPNNILQEFNGGGSHEEMSNGGIQVGMGENGAPNTVEQNETMSGGYVFSDRLKLDKEILDKYYLPKKYKDKSPAEVSKLISAAHKENNNIIDKESTQESLDRLIQASEELRQIEEIKNKPPSMLQMEDPNSMMDPNMMQDPSQGMDPAMMEQMMMQEQGQNQMFFGGDTENEEGMTGEGFMNMAGGAMELGQTAFGKTGIDTSGAQRYGAGKTNGGAALSGAMTGAKAGMALGPWGAAAGAVIGAGAGILGNTKAQKELAEAQMHGDMADNALYNTRANGGFINTFDTGGVPNPWGFDFSKIATSIPNVTGNSNDIHNPTNNPLMFSNTPNGINNTDPAKNFIDFNKNNGAYSTLDGNVVDVHGQMGDGKESFLSKAGKVAGSATRYAPVAANAYQLATLKPAEKTSLDRLDQRFNPSFVDERSMINRSMSDFNASVGDLKNASNGSLGTLRNSLMGAHLNRARSLSDASLNAKGMNNQQRGMAQQFNLGVNSTNLQQSNHETDINMRNQAAYDNNKSKFISALGNDFGNIGLEELRKQYPEMAGMDYDSRGRYLAAIEAEKRRKKGQNA